ncbi:MAG: gliding motility lipoprotein GldH [Paludibacteraceae bacterium]|nr:gliding motility lipoprotein GldH [Paludibacteraceae bacterium]
MNKIVGFLLMVLGCLSCSDEGVVFQQAKEFPASGWSKDSVAVFNYEAVDTTGAYDIVVDLRNDGSYRYQNFWLFIRSVSPDSVVFSDTLECVLADNYGRWIGEGSGSFRHLPVMFLSEVKFPKTGVYSFELVQGMREDVLAGIHDVGIRIMKSKPEDK